MTSIASQIMSSTPDPFEAYDRLVAEVKVLEAQGITGAELDELKDAIEAQDEEWADQQAAEIEAEMGIERYYENRDWAEQEAFSQYEHSMGLF